MEIPKSISGRPVTGRGVHLQPSGFHAFWCGNKKTRDYWIELMQSMDMSWCVIITESDSVLEVFDGKSVVHWLLEAGIIPIVRWQAAINRVFTGENFAKKLAIAYKPFGIKPLIQIYNEPLDGREYDGHVPSDEKWGIFIRRWNGAAGQLIRAGCYPGFPDGPGYNFRTANPFRDSEKSYWLDGFAWYGVHNYGKGRPLNYPYDKVTRHGDDPNNWLTQAEYDAALGCYAGDPEWQDKALDEINKARTQQANPDLTSMQDDVCWMAWEKILEKSNEYLGFDVPLFMTEGGWQPKDRAGSGPNADIRWPQTTPEEVARKTVAMFNAPSPFIAQCPWLLGCTWMGGTGWEDDSWAGGSFKPPYGFEKPVVAALQRKTTVHEHLVEAERLMEGVVDALRL